MYPSVAVSQKLDCAAGPTQGTQYPTRAAAHPDPVNRPHDEASRDAPNRHPTPPRGCAPFPSPLSLFPLPASPLAGDRRGGVGGAETPVAAAATMGDHEARGDDFEKKAEKKLTGWGIFGSKYEDAADLFDKAANSFKLAKNCERSWLRRSPSRHALSPNYFRPQSVRFDCRCCLQPLDLPPDRGPGSGPRCLVRRSSERLGRGVGSWAADLRPRRVILDALGFV